MAPHSKCWLENFGDTTDPMWVWVASDTTDGLCHHDVVTQKKTGPASGLRQLGPRCVAPGSCVSQQRCLGRPDRTLASAKPAEDEAAPVSQRPTVTATARGMVWLRQLVGVDA